MTPASIAACAVAKVTGCAVDDDFALVGLVDAGQDLDERGFAGAVFANQRRDLAGVERDADIVERLHAGKNLRNAPHFEDGRRVCWGLLCSVAQAVGSSGLATLSKGEGLASRDTGVGWARRQTKPPGLAGMTGSDQKTLENWSMFEAL